MKSFNRNQKVFLITIDALRPDHLKIYGYKRDPAPNISKFSNGSLVFLNAFTNGPETPSSFSSIFTSTLPLLDGGFSPLPPQKIYLPQILKENGIFCYAIHSNPNLSKMFNYDRGFDVFLDGERYKSKPKDNFTLKQFLIYYLRKLINYRNYVRKIIFRLVGFNKIKNILRRRLPKITDILLPFTPIAYNAPYLINKITSFLNQHEGPLFLWAHFMDVHSPFNPPKRNLIKVRGSEIPSAHHAHLINDIYENPNDYEITQRVLDDLIDLYDGEINFVDENLGLLFDYIKKKINDECLIIILADHGEAFYEHGYFNHQGNVYDELLKVPLILKQLNNIGGLKHINEITQLLDIAPTILDFFNIAIPDQFKGRSLLPYNHGKNIEKIDLIFSESYQKNGKMKRNNIEGLKIISIRKDDWKFIYDQEKDEELLFNVKKDPDEKHNQINDHPEITKTFRIILKRHLKKIDSVSERSKLSSVIKDLNFDEL